VGGAHKWIGPFVGTDWNTYFNERKHIYTLQEYYKYPLIQIGPPSAICRPPIVTDLQSYHYLVMGDSFAEAEALVKYPICLNASHLYQYCSQKCWALQEKQLISNELSTLDKDHSDSYIQYRIKQLYELDALISNEWDQYRQKWGG
jgi:hypothetical protein